MKVLFIIISSLISISSYSGTTYNSSNFIVEQSLKSVVNKITDYENICENNCKYKLKFVKKIKIIKDNTYQKNSFYIWTHIKSSLSSKFFSHIEIIKKGESVFVIQKQVEDIIAKKLEKKTGLKHSPLLKELVSSYELFTNNKKVHVNYTIEVGYSGLILNLASNSIKSNIENSIKEIKRNIASTSKI